MRNFITQAFRVWSIIILATLNKCYINLLQSYIALRWFQVTTVQSNVHYRQISKGGEVNLRGTFGKPLSK